MILRAAAVLLLALLLGGCGLLQSFTRPAGEPAPPIDAATPTRPAVAVEVVAPPELKALLERHLDLVRLGALTREDAVDSTEWTRLIDATPAQVRELLQTEGYFAPQITVERLRVEGDGRPGAVRLIVEPGPAATVDRVTYEIQGDLHNGTEAGDPHAMATMAEARRTWPLPPGKRFRNADWGDAKTGVLARVRAAGYAAASWSGTAAEIDPKGHTVRIFLVLDSGPLFRFGRLRIDGLEAQDASTVQHLAGFDKGAPVTETLLLDFQDRLQKAGLFDSVSVTLNPNPERAEAAVVRVRLRESPLQVYTFGVGVDSNTGGRLSVEHVDRRLFGYAATARNKAEIGTVRQAWEGEISTHPGERLYRNLIGGAVEALEGTDDEVVSQRLRVGRAKETQRIERLAFVEAERSVRRTALANSQTLALSANYHGVWRGLDNLLLPTRGYTLAVQLGAGYSRSSAADNGPFTRAYGRLTGYLPLGGQWYGQARIEAGQVFVRKSVEIPDSQLFRAGGEDSVRGYSYRSLGPEVNGVVGGGKVLLTTSLELAHPISAAIPALWGAVFVDAGRAADSFQQFDAAIGAGVGVRWRSPVGPLRLDWAWAPELNTGRLHFSVGVAF